MLLNVACKGVGGFLLSAYVANTLAASTIVLDQHMQATDNVAKQYSSEIFDVYSSTALVLRGTVDQRKYIASMNIRAAYVRYFKDSFSDRFDVEGQLGIRREYFKKRFGVFVNDTYYRAPVSADEGDVPTNYGTNNIFAAGVDYALLRSRRINSKIGYQINDLYFEKTDNDLFIHRYTGNLNYNYSSRHTSINELEFSDSIFKHNIGRPEFYDIGIRTGFEFRERRAILRGRIGWQKVILDDAHQKDIEGTVGEISYNRSVSNTLDFLASYNRLYSAVNPGLLDRERNVFLRSDTTDDFFGSEVVQYSRNQEVRFSGFQRYRSHDIEASYILREKRFADTSNDRLRHEVFIAPAISLSGGLDLLMKFSGVRYEFIQSRRRDEEYTVDISFMNTFSEHSYINIGVLRGVKRSNEVENSYKENVLYLSLVLAKSPVL